jgi:hypothetical protein
VNLTNQKPYKGNDRTNQYLPKTRTHIIDLSPFRKKVLLSLTSISLLYTSPSTVLAATTQTVQTAIKKPSFGEAFMPLIQLLQEAALPVGIGIAIWGMIEWMLDNPGGKDRVKKAVGCYIGIYVVPYIFLVIRDAFHGMM